MASAGRALLGSGERPADLDLETSWDEAPSAARALGLRLVEDGSNRRLARRALGTIRGVALDLSGGTALLDESGGVMLPSSPQLQRAACVPVRVAGRRILVGPPEEDLVRMLLLGELERARRLTAALPPAHALRRDYVARRLAAAVSAAR